MWILYSFRASESILELSFYNTSFLINLTSKVYLPMLFNVLYGEKFGMIRNHEFCDNVYKNLLSIQIADSQHSYK